ncbi:hemerythrin domain-containing protein [uncultured Brevundimonas sp.]|uniref:hemerythrin domain-containing protein n=1 Tax=uncultured Brevundimonas sp. TaxID=213418 RepID=UPI0030ECAC65|tara:strand:- start:195 stop:785 length:591 start_codon:yes stop_codon:yes gene_type:complete
MSQKPQIEALPQGLVHEPLNWLFAEHYRHRQLCRLIERVGTATVLLREEAEEILTFLRQDMALHIIDEEEDLFPLLRRRCLPEDELGPLLGSLSAEHRDDMEQTRVLTALLERALSEGQPPGHDLETRRLFTEFALHERRHIALENAIILPIARLRLTPRDLRALSTRMAARRGVVLDRTEDEMPADGPASSGRAP